MLVAKFLSKYYNSKMDSPKKYIYISIFASVLNLFLKFGAWYITDSVGLLSDALETVVNITAALLALLAISTAIKPADENHAYGHGKAEYFSSGAEGMLIIIASGGIVFSALQRFHAPMVPQNLSLGLFVALLSSLVNYAAAKILLKGAQKHDSLALEADSKHLMTDVYTSLGLIAGLAVMIFTPPSWAILDPIIALIMAVNILFTGFNLMKSAYNGLMDKALLPDEVDYIVSIIHNLIGEKDEIHSLRTRKSGSRKFIDFHLLVKGETTVKESHDLCEKIEKEIYKGLPNSLVTIHVEPIEDESSYDCRSQGGICFTKKENPQ